MGFVDICSFSLYFGEMFKSKLSVVSTAMLVASAILFGLPTNAMAAKQRVNFFIGGECSDNYDDFGEYAVYEEGFDECYFEIKVTKPGTTRTMLVQYFDDEFGEWVTENSARTNRRGNAVVYVETYCGEEADAFCDGTWTYRILVPKKGAEKRKTSEEVDISFYPIAL